MTVPLPIPADDPRISNFVASWPSYQSLYPAPRSKWLSDVESVLRTWFPAASSDELTLTARNLAPFPLALPGVP